MKELQEFSSDYDKYLNSILDALRAFGYVEASVNRHEYVCIFYYTINLFNLRLDKITKVKHETLKAAMAKGKFPKSITDLLK